MKNIKCKSPSVTNTEGLSLRLFYQPRSTPKVENKGIAWYKPTPSHDV